MYAYSIGKHRSNQRHPPSVAYRKQSKVLVKTFIAVARNHYKF